MPEAIRTALAIVGALTLTTTAILGIVVAIVAKRG